jgi:alanyl-tRNA synthetase
MTTLLYLDQQRLTRASAIIQQVIPLEEKGLYKIVVDQTLFYPQGGGQPSDQGVIHNEKGTFKVNMVRIDYDTGLVAHEGQFSKGHLQFQVGDKVELEIDWDLRWTHTKCHSAGHLMDHAAQALNLPFQAGRAYHFMDAPFVEYIVTQELTQDKNELATLLQDKCNELMDQDIPVNVVQVPMSSLPPKTLDSIPEKLRGNPSIRMIQFGNYPMTVCGGTHVSSSKQIGPFTIRKLMLKKDRLKVCYNMK